MPKTPFEELVTAAEKQFAQVSLSLDALQSNITTIRNELRQSVYDLETADANINGNINRLEDLFCDHPHPRFHDRLNKLDTRCNVLQSHLNTFANPPPPEEHPDFIGRYDILEAKTLQLDHVLAALKAELTKLKGDQDALTDPA